MLPEMEELSSELAAIDDGRDDNRTLLEILHVIREKYHDGWGPWFTFRMVARENIAAKLRRLGRMLKKQKMKVKKVVCKKVKLSKRHLSPLEILYWRKMFLNLPLTKNIIFEFLCLNVDELEIRRLSNGQKRRLMPLISDHVVKVIYSEHAKAADLIQQVHVERNPRFKGLF